MFGSFWSRYLLLLSYFDTCFDCTFGIQWFVEPKHSKTLQIFLKRVKNSNSSNTNYFLEDIHMSVRTYSMSHHQDYLQLNSRNSTSLFGSSGVEVVRWSFKVWLKLILEDDECIWPDGDAAENWSPQLSSRYLVLAGANTQLNFHVWCPGTLQLEPKSSTGTNSSYLYNSLSKLIRSLKFLRSSKNNEPTSFLVVVQFISTTIWIIIISFRKYNSSLCFRLTGNMRANIRPTIVQPKQRLASARILDSNMAPLRCK